MRAQQFHDRQHTCPGTDIPYHQVLLLVRPHFIRIQDDLVDGPRFGQHRPLFLPSALLPAPTTVRNLTIEALALASRTPSIGQIFHQPIILLQNLLPRRLYLLFQLADLQQPLVSLLAASARGPC